MELPDYQIRLDQGNLQEGEDQLALKTGKTVWRPKGIQLNKFRSTMGI